MTPISNPSQVVVLTGDRDGQWNHNEPAWSPDGTRLCYAAWDGLWVVPAAGGAAQRLTLEESDQHPAWSADGRHVYFVSWVERRATLWRVSLASGERERVTLGSGSEVSPHVSRDGRVLAFASTSGDDNLVTIDLANGVEHDEFGTGKDDFFPSVGPEGRVVYFTADRWGLHDVWRVPLLNGSATGEPGAGVRPVRRQDPSRGLTGRAMARVLPDREGAREDADPRRVGGRDAPAAPQSR